jgi:GAF domain-containing protein
MPPRRSSPGHEPSVGADVARSAFQLAVDDLLYATGASRATLRLDWPGWGLHVDDVAAEALVPGIESLKGKTSIDQRRAATVGWLERERRPLIQEDCSSADEPPPPELLRIYGVRAQMLGPVVWSGRLVGWVSVHETRSERRWSRDDVTALDQATSAVECALLEYSAS